MAFSVLPGWVAPEPRAGSPYSCLSSGQVSPALAEVHSFVLFTNSQRNFTGWGRVERKQDQKEEEKEKRRQSLPQ